jgi:FlaA1/EpsC-like NDP-sugar epimerase
MMGNMVKRYGVVMGSLLIDTIFVTLSYFGSYLLRFEGAIPYYMVPGVWYALPIFVSVKLFFFYYFGLYRALWRYTGIVDVMNIVKARPQRASPLCSSSSSSSASVSFPVPFTSSTGAHDPPH